MNKGQLIRSHCISWELRILREPGSYGAEEHPVRVMDMSEQRQEEDGRPATWALNTHGRRSQAHSEMHCESSPVTCHCKRMSVRWLFCISCKILFFVVLFCLFLTGI